MIVNRNSGNTQFVRTNQTKQAKGCSFGEALNKASYAKDTFNSSSVSGTDKTTLDNEAFSTLSDTMAKLDRISAAIKDTDYSGMTKAEIYADIENKYTDVFDDYFASRVVSPCKDYEEINYSFIMNVKENIGTATFPVTLVNEARGYSGMSYDEIEAAIKEKYVGKNGFTDQLNLLGELFTSGVLSNKFGKDETFEMTNHLSLSLQCRGDGVIPKNEWLERISQTGASSPFTIFLNYPYFENIKELFKTMVDDILFGVVGVTK